MEPHPGGRARPPLVRPGAGDGQDYKPGKLLVVFLVLAVASFGLSAFAAWDVIAAGDSHWEHEFFMGLALASQSLMQAAQLRLRARGVANWNPFRFHWWREASPGQRRLAVGCLIFMGLTLVSVSLAVVSSITPIAFGL